MKKLAALLVVFAATAYGADTFFSVSASTSTTAPDCDQLASTAGADLSAASGYNVVVSAGSNVDAGAQSLFATGTLNCCAYLPITGASGGSATTRRWMKCPSSLNIALSNCTTGWKDCVSGDFEVLAGMGRIAYVPSAAVVDGGTTVTTTINVRRNK